MRDSEHIATGLLTAADGLRQLILDNPGLPLLVFAGEDANIGEYGYMACSSVRASLGVFLDCQQEVDDTYCFTDKDDFSERLEDQLYEGVCIAGVKRFRLLPRLYLCFESEAAPANKVFFVRIKKDEVDRV